MNNRNSHNLVNKEEVRSHEALDFCVLRVFVEFAKHDYSAAFDRLLNGEGFWSDDGWELCRVKHRYLADKVNITEVNEDGFLAWTHAEDFGLQPSYRIYSEDEFAAFFPESCSRARKLLGLSFEPKLAADLEEYFP